MEIRKAKPEDADKLSQIAFAAKSALEISRKMA